MKWELMVVALFWLVYGPASFVIWEYTSSHLGSLVALLTAGIVFTATFLGGRLLMQHIKAKQYGKLNKDVLDQLTEDETVHKGDNSFGTSEAVLPAEPEADSEETEEVLEEKASAPQESLD